MFKKLFGAKPQTPGVPGGSSAANQTINAMQSLAEREEQLEKKKLLLEKRINDEMEKAREFTRQKKKSQALMCLKKKKMFEQQLERMDALISRVLEQRNMLEEQQTTIGVLGAMQDAAKAQKKTMQASARGCSQPSVLAPLPVQQRLFRMNICKNQSKLHAGAASPCRWAYPLQLCTK